MLCTKRDYNLESAFRFFMAYVMYQTSWSVFLLFFVCFIVIPFCPAGAMLFNIKSQFRYIMVVEGSCTGS